VTRFKKLGSAVTKLPDAEPGKVDMFSKYRWLSSSLFVKRQNCKSFWKSLHYLTTSNEKCLRYKTAKLWNQLLKSQIVLSWWVLCMSGERLKIDNFSGLREKGLNLIMEILQESICNFLHWLTQIYKNQYSYLTCSLWVSVWRVEFWQKLLKSNLPKTWVRLFSLDRFFRVIDEVSFLPISTLSSSIFVYVYFFV
jgi:hypothetical protein